MAEKPIFSGQMVECGRDGSNSALEITRPKRVTVSADGLQLGSQRVPYSDVLEMSVRGNVLSLTLREQGGRRAERHFRYDTFLPGTGVRRLAEVGRRLAERVQRSAAASPPRLTSPRAEQLQSTDRYTVRVCSSQVAFPASCPVCLAPGTRPAQLPVSAGLDSGTWIVPVCAVHREFGTGIRVQGWSLKSSEITFSFDRPDYGERFLRLNTGDQRPDPTATTAALREINGGTRFVVYTYAVSVILVSFKRTTPVCVIEPGASRVLHGLPYTLLSLVLGWWGIPHGPIYTISSLIANLKGGIDLTPSLAAVINGRRVTAMGA